MLKLLDSGLAWVSWGLAALVWVLLFAGPSLIGADKEKPAAAGATVDGKAVFAEAGCGGCHTLGAAGSTGTTGPSLDGGTRTPEGVAAIVKSGSGLMPAFSGKLNDAEITAVADFVARASGGGAASPTATATATATETATPEPEPTETATPEPAPTEDAAAAGRQVFASAGCASCHTLAAAGASGQSAPSLDALSPSTSQVIEAVTNGRGQMPAFGGQLTKEQIRSLAEFVADVAGN